MSNIRPSPRFIKHGWLKKGEYNPDLHSFGRTMDERNIRTYQPRTTYYTPEEMEKMRQEIKIAECPICFEEINDDRCRVCENGHKFHNRCLSLQNNENLPPVSICPICNSAVIHSCGNIYSDITSGGKRIKRKNKITIRKKYKKINKKNKKSRKTGLA